MRRLLVGMLVTTVWLFPLAASAQREKGNCPPEQTGFDRVDVEEWIARTLEAIEDFGVDITDPRALDEFAQSLGFEDFEASLEFIRAEQWSQIDRNDNGFACMKDLPNTPGLPDFYFIGVDDRLPARG